MIWVLLTDSDMVSFSGRAQHRGRNVRPVADPATRRFRRLVSLAGKAVETPMGGCFLTQAEEEGERGALGQEESWDSLHFLRSEINQASEEGLSLTS